MNNIYLQYGLPTSLICYNYTVKAFLLDWDLI